ncbi:hypothetical protein [Nocardiopsis sp. YSL2]|uniref:hypothetical protein n=1 Tax=Nocardiopsis sp. YSL2 TaxID=2939492 RepID=UPI0026F463CC|nr:hypothetical protein [Nocardiopsis sp. YSL2]
MSALHTLFDTVREHLRPTKEPLAYIAFGVAVLFLGYEMLVNGQSFTEVFGENYIEGIVAVLVTLLGRASVYSPRTVKAADTAFLDVHLGTDMVADDEQG